MDEMCKHCGRKPSRFTLGILNDPQFCSRECLHRWVLENLNEVVDYLEDVMTTEEK